MKLFGTGESALALFRILLCFNELFFFFFLPLNAPFEQEFIFVMLVFFFSFGGLVQTMQLADFLAPVKAAADNLQQ